MTKPFKRLRNFEFNANFSKEQEGHIDSLKWFFFGPKRSGRTYLVAVLFIDYAINNPGYPVPIIDHFKSDHHYRAAHDQVCHIIAQFPITIRKRFIITQFEIKFN